MGLEGTAPRRRLKSVVVLLIGLAYLGGVYWASPTLRQDMRFRNVWYGWPWQSPPRTYYRVGTDLALKGFEERLVEHADATQDVRMTMEVTTRWRHTGVRYDGEYPEGEEYVSPLRERHVTVTFLLDRGSHPDSRPSMTLVIEGENWWCAWFRGTGTDRYLLSDQRPHVPESVCRKTWRSSTRILDDDERKPIVNDYMIPLWPFVCPPAFNDLLNGRRVSRGEDAEIDGRMCRSVRIETRWEKSTPSVCTLWMPKGEDRVVKVEYVPPFWPELVEKLTGEQLAELGTVCIVTSYEETDSFADDKFDPAPLLERWAADVAEAVAKDVEKIKERESRGFGDFGQPGFGEETDDENGWGGGFGGSFGDSDELDNGDNDTANGYDDGDAEEGAAE